MKQLAEDLTSGCTGDYDKLKVIETYLNSLTYTTRIGKTPKEEDFVDYFLFEQKKGYCTYFATAMAVLGRCIGIPTRYVEGFIVDYKNQEEPYTYRVQSSNAHAWAEAYIRGAGWIPLEATPGYYDGRYTPWAEDTKGEGYQDSGVTLYEITPTPPPYMANPTGDINGYLTEEEQRHRKNYFLTVVILLFGIILLAVSVLASYYGILERKYKKKLLSASDTVKLTLILTEILRYLEKAGYQLSKEETLFTYSQRIGKRLLFQDITFMYVAEVFMRVRYGEYEIKKEELDAVIGFHGDLKKYLTEKLGKRKMFIDRFLFLHFYTGNCETI